MLTPEMIYQEAEDLKEYTRDLRRTFHKMAEVSTKEFKTSARIQEELTAMGIPFPSGMATLAGDDWRSAG